MLTLFSTVSYTEHGFMSGDDPCKFQHACISVEDKDKGQNYAHNNYTILTTSATTSEISAYTVRSFASLPGKDKTKHHE